MVGIRFLSEQGGFLNVLVNEAQAKEIFASWVQPGRETFHGMNPDGTGWCVRTKGLWALHTFDPGQLQAPAQQQAAPYQPPGFMRTSG